jgi:hypothetical protein
MRHEIFDGTDRHDAIAVNRPNSIENRLSKLLIYLRQTYPGKGWEQYLENDSVIVWQKIIVSGHSQGGGHAGFISKQKEVARVVMFAAADVLPLLGRRADWVTMPGPTPPERYFGFIHELDESIPLTAQLNMWSDYGMPAFGDLVLTDSIAAPYNASHMLYSRLLITQGPVSYHGCIVVSYYTPKDANGNPIYEPVWEYMIGSTDSVSVGTVNLGELSLNVFPNPVLAGNSFFVKMPAPADGVLTLFAPNGMLIWEGRFSNKTDLEIPSTDLPSGAYWLKIATNTAVYSKKIIVHHH